jgi:hypothetical protein
LEKEFGSKLLQREKELKTIMENTHITSLEELKKYSVDYK